MFIHFIGQGRNIIVNTDTISEIDLTVTANKPGSEGAFPAVKVVVQRPLSAGMGEFNFTFGFNDEGEQAAFKSDFATALGKEFYTITLPEIKGHDNSH